MMAAEAAADAAGWSYEAMMEAAGKAVADLMLARFDLTGQPVLVLVGPGNNGGDGLVTARYLAQAGATVTVYLWRARQPAADKVYQQTTALNLAVYLAESDPYFAELKNQLAQASFVVDALLGTGNNRPVTGQLAALLQTVAGELAGRQAGDSAPLHSLRQWRPAPSHRPQTIAVDCPSGLYCDDGRLDPLTLPADITITFAGPKRGHLLPPGAAACGELVVADIGIDLALPAVDKVQAELVTPAKAWAALPARPRTGHKGSFGRVMIVGGSDQYRGAPLLAGLGAFRAGAGLVNMALPGVVRAAALAFLPEASYLPVPGETLLDAATAAWLATELPAYRAVLLGPGIGPAGEFLAAFLRLAELTKPLVVDADALNWLATQPDWPLLLPSQSLLTPHPGEMARLLGISLSELLAQNRIEVAQEAAASWNQIVLLKGAYTVVAHPDGRVMVMPFANPLLGVGGSGDVLGGLIVSLTGQGATLWTAAWVGAYLHGAAGESVRAQYGDAGLLAREIANAVPAVRQAMKPGYASPRPG